MNNRELHSWSIDDSEGSTEGPGSKHINAQLDSLRLSSLDSTKSDDDGIVPRGKLEKCKSNRSNQSHKSKTSVYVWNIMQPCDSNRSLGYSSSQSPSLDYTTPVVSPFLEVSHSKNSTKSQAHGKSMKKLLEDFIHKRKNDKKQKVEPIDWIFDFGETQLMKTCRRGQITAVKEALKELVDNQQLGLINYQNNAKETALSIATYQMNEAMICLLLEYGALPHKPLAMNNNVLHIAADLDCDDERKTYSYLLKGIALYQHDSLFPALIATNLFSADPKRILELHLIANGHNDRLSFYLQRKIEETQMLLKEFYMRFSVAR